MFTDVIKDLQFFLRKQVMIPYQFCYSIIPSNSAPLQNLLLHIDSLTSDVQHNRPNTKARLVDNILSLILKFSFNIEPTFFNV